MNEPPAGPAIQASNKPTTEDEIISRLERTASSLPARTTLQRVSMADAAYPRTEAENIAMGGYALLLVTSVAHEATELPLARVVVQNAAGELPLQRAALRHSELADARLATILGSHRTDELYYLPVFLTRVQSVLAVDFAKNRSGLEVLHFPPPPHDDAFPADISVIAEISTPTSMRLRSWPERSLDGRWSSGFSAVPKDARR